jgi:AcrR family transcriptional regulator
MASGVTKPARPGGPDRAGPGSCAGEPIPLGRLVALSGVPPSTVHHYRRLGLLPEPELTRQGRYVYSEVHLHALQLIRELREERSMGLGQIKAVLPDLMDGRHPLPPATPDCSEEPQKRLVDAAFKLFSEPKGYAAVTVSEIAATAGVAKGTVYRHFPSKEALFTAVVESLCQDTAERFAQAVAELGGPEGLAHDPGKTAVVFGRLITRAMPILLELGARAARGDFPSQILAARVLRTLAEAAGRPLSDDPVPAGLEVIETAFATVLQWAVGPDWALRPASP